jgi:Tol biopolymer transport system component
MSRIKQIIMKASLLICCMLLTSGGHIHLGKNDTSAVKIERVWSGTSLDFITGDISPDGKYYSDINWDTGDLRLVDLETGEIREVTGKGYGAGRYAWVSAFSHDSEKIAVTWYLYGEDGHELRIMNLDGTDSRVLVSPDENWISIEPLDWSPSGEYIAVALDRRDYNWDLGWVSVRDGSVKVLKHLGWLAPGGDHAYPEGHMSPDGEFLGYDYRPDLQKVTRDIYALSIESGVQTTLVSGPSTNRFLGWIPGEDAILFYSDRNGSPGIWRLSVKDGQPVGEPALVKADMPGLIPLGFSEDDYLYGITANAGWRLHHAAFDREYKELAREPQPLDDPPFDSNFGGHWSPDGKYIACFNHGPSPGMEETLTIRSVDGEIVRELKLSPTIHTSYRFSKWVETGIISSAKENRQNGIFRFDINDGSHEELYSHDSPLKASGQWFEASPDGQTLYLIGPPDDEGGTRDLIKWDVATATYEVIGNFRLNTRSMTLSSDGGTLAFSARNENGTDEIRTFRTSGHEKPKVVYSSSQDQRIGIPVSWTPDGQGILFCMTTPDDGPHLWSKKVDSEEEPTRIPGAESCCGTNSLRIQPNGYDFISYGGSKYQGEIWKMTDF